MRWLLLPPDLRATEEQVQLLATTIAYSFAASVSLLLIWRHIIAPRLPGYKFTKPSDRVFLGNSFVSLYPALTAPILAMVSMRRLSWDVGSAMLSGPDDAGLRAVGISCGYMAYDVCYCSYYREVRSPQPCRSPVRSHRSSASPHTPKRSTLSHRTLILS